MINVLELFCGTKSIGKEAERLGYNVFSSDFEPKFEADYTCDIRDFNVNKVPFKPDIIWASPPCTYFSVASIGKHWNKDHTPKTKEALIGVELVQKTIDIIKYFNPSIWYIENPRGKLRKLPVVKDLPIRHTVTYCQYGDTRMKPSDLFTNNEVWKPRPMCKNGDSCHEAAPRGARTGTQGLKGNMERSVIPPDLCYEVMCQIPYVLKVKA